MSKEKERAQKAEKETESVLAQIRELKLKLSTSRMREEENLRTIADMQHSMEIKKANHQMILNKLQSQNEKFKLELD